MTNKTNVEHERKYKLKQGALDALVSALEESGFKKASEQVQEDAYWDDSQYTITNLKRGLRTRTVKGKLVSVELKSLFRNADGAHVVEEVPLYNKKTRALDVKKAREVLENRFGFKKAVVTKSTCTPDSLFRQYGLSEQIVLSKLRACYVDSEAKVEIALDTIEGLGRYLEIEMIGDDEKHYDGIVQYIEKGMGDKVTFEKRGYLDLLMHKNTLIRTSDEFQALFDNDCAWNVLPTERSIVGKLFRDR